MKKIKTLVFDPAITYIKKFKNLLGKTANLTFRFIIKGSEETFGSEKLEFEDGSEEAIVSKRIIMSGDNLVNAQPSYDNINSQTIVNFTLDRTGAKKFGRATSKHTGKRLAIILDNKIISAPQIREPILSGNGQKMELKFGFENQ